MIGLEDPLKGEAEQEGGAEEQEQGRYGPADDDPDGHRELAEPPGAQLTGSSRISREAVMVAATPTRPSCASRRTISPTHSTRTAVP